MSHPDSDHQKRDFKVVLNAADAVIGDVAHATSCSMCQLDILSLALCLLVKFGGYTKQDMLTNLDKAFDMPEIDAILGGCKDLVSTARH